VLQKGKGDRMNWGSSNLKLMVCHLIQISANKDKKLANRRVLYVCHKKRSFKNAAGHSTAKHTCIAINDTILLIINSFNPANLQHFLHKFICLSHLSKAKPEEGGDVK
jgi:hypothetical protein